MYLDNLLNMSSIKYQEKLSLKVAQFKLLCSDTQFVSKKNIELALHGLDLNLKIPYINVVNDHDERKIISGSLLHLAFETENIVAYDTLLSLGADFNLTDKNGNTALHNAFYQFCSNYSRFNRNFRNFSKVNLTGYNTDIEKFILSTLSAHVRFENTNNPSDPNGLTHFHIACGTNNTVAVEFFLCNGTSVNQAVVSVSSEQVFQGYTPLHFAAEFGCIEVIEILLKNCANTNLEDENGKTPIHVAVERNIQIVDAKLPRDIELNENVKNLLLSHSFNKKFPSIVAASAMKNLYNVESLLAQGVNPNQSISVDSKNWPGYTGLHFAAHVNVNTVKLLVKHGANVLAKEQNGVTPFGMCIDRYAADDVCDIICLVSNWKNILLSDGKTRLVDLLLAFKDLDGIKNFLKESKDNVTLYVPFDSPLWPGFTVLHLAVQFTEREKCQTDYKLEEGRTRRTFDPDLRIILECLKQNADVNVKDHRNCTPIHLAFKLRKEKTLELLLKYHCGVENLIDEENLSYLHIACAAKNKDLAEKLLRNNADVNIAYKGEPIASKWYTYAEPGWTPLHISVYKGNNDIIKLLLKYGADVHATDMFGFTPIHNLVLHHDFAEHHGYILFNNITISHDVVVKDVELSYLHVACAADHVDAVKRYLDLGADINKVIACKVNLKKYSVYDTFENIFNGSTPFNLALDSYNDDRSELLSLLIERGADILTPSLQNNPVCEILDSPVSEFLDVIIDAFKTNTNLQNRVKMETGITLLHFACCRVDINLVTELLANGVNINAQIHENSSVFPKHTCLHILLARHDDSTFRMSIGDDIDANIIIKMLLDQNVDVTLADSEQLTSIHMAHNRLRKNKDDLLGNNLVLLLKAQKNFEINPSNAEGLSHFHIACHMLEIDVVKNFLECNVDVNLKTDVFCRSDIAARTPLLFAAQSFVNLKRTDSITFSFAKLLTQLKIVNLLIKNGADVTVEDVFGNTPAHYVGLNNYSKKNLLQTLSNNGADVNARNVKGETPFQVLLKDGESTLEDVRYFITCECHLNAFNTITDTGYIALVDYLLEHDEMQLLLFETFVNFPNLMKNDDMKRTAIHNIVSINKSVTNSEQYVELFDILMTFGCDVDDQDSLGRTALHLAAQFRNESAVAGLLSVGANMNIIDCSGKTAFAYVLEPCSRCLNKNKKDHDQYSHSDLLKVFVSHIKKMELCNIYVNHENVDLLDRALEKLGSDGISSDLDSTLSEIERLANMKIEPYSVTAADFVSADDIVVIHYPMMSLAKRKTIDKFFRKNKTNFQAKFEYTAGILELQYRQAVFRQKIINPAIESLRVLARCRLPDICAHVIIKSLKNFELQNLIDSTAESQVK